VAETNDSRRPTQGTREPAVEELADRVRKLLTTDDE